MLGDAAVFLSSYVGTANRVQKRSLTVIDVAHDRDHRRPCPQRGLLFFDLVFDFESTFSVESYVFHLMVELRSDQSRCVRVEHLIDGRHHAHAHQLLDHFAGFNTHLPRQVADGNDLGNSHDSLARSGNCDFGPSDLFARQNSLFHRSAPAAHIFFSGLEHVLFLDDALLVTSGLRLLLARGNRGTFGWARCSISRSCSGLPRRAGYRFAQYWRRRRLDAHSLLEIDASENTRTASRRFRLHGWRGQRSRTLRLRFRFRGGLRDRIKEHSRFFLRRCSGFFRWLMRRAGSLSEYRCGRHRFRFFDRPDRS
jgi:hypothetical protein